MKCKICNTESDKIFKKQVLDKYDVQYYKCPNCDFVNTERAYWLEEAYGKSINISDTGILSRNINFVEKLTPVFCLFFNKSANFLDWGGGYGIFVRMMRDTGFDFKWHDPYTENIFAKSFEMEEGVKYEALTCFEVFEHLENPMYEIEKVLKYSDTIIFSTNLTALTNNIEDWDYLCPEHGQHISFYSYKTLKFIADKFNMTLFSNRKNIHIFTSKKIKMKCFLKLLLNLKHRYSILLFETSKLFMKSKTVEDSLKLKY